MSSEWPSARLGELCVKIGSGSTPRGGSNVYVDEGARFIRSKNVYDLRFEFAGLAHLDDRAAEQLRGVAVQPNDVLVNITGDSVARVCLAPDDGRDARVSQHVAIVRPDPARVVARFLSYWLVSPRAKAHLLTLASAGATRKALTKAMLEALQVPLPSVEEQQRIVSVLGALDDKIQSNSRLADVLDDAATELFGRLRQEANGRPQSLGASVDLIPGRSYASADLDDPGCPTGLLTLKCVKPGGGFDAGGVRHYAGNYKPTQVVRSGEVVVAHTDLTQSASVLGRPALVREVEGFDRLVASMHVPIVRPSDDLPVSYLYYLLRSDEFHDYAYSQSHGTTVLMLNKQALLAFPFRLPRARELAEFDRSVGAMTAQRHGIAQESEQLARVRDTVLPKLVSGEIRVPRSHDSGEMIGALAEGHAA
jgi:type I restriction enzyme, S subunit